jgi:hypothetical protein
MRRRPARFQSWLPIRRSNLLSALTFGIAFPLFRLWIRRGYSNVAEYIGGGVVVAATGAVLITMAHVLFSDFLTDSDFRFAILLIGICGPVAGAAVWYVLQRSSE